MSLFDQYGAAQARGPRQEQQDRFCILSYDGVFAVFDGHGPDGAIAAAIAADCFGRRPEVPFAPYFSGDEFIIPSQDLTRHFGELSSRMAGLRGGTTATSVHVGLATPYDRIPTVSVNNVGDSPAYLIDPNNPDRENGILCLTEQHNTSNPSEVDRMRRLGIGVIQFHAGGPLYFDDKKGGGTIVSRSLGDPGVPGIVSTPHFHQWQSRAERLLLVTTDGVLNKQTAEFAIEDTLRMFRQRKRMSEIALSLVDKYSGITADNATAIAVHIPGISV